MRVKFFSLLALASILALSLAFVACGDDDTVDGDSAVVDDDDTSGADSAGAIVPNTFLTYDGAQYRLADILQADLEDESEFAEAGEATAADVDGDLTVYSREGDDSSVFTFFEGSGEGESATPDNWYRWEPTD